MKSKKQKIEIFLKEKLSKNEQKSILGGDQQEVDPTRMRGTDGTP
ncbi:hypothetical protein [Flavobacterium pectinovorum]|uniref:Bacteriocin-type signal sequence-containing protein n=1 Tax=Flavobacterium pectinovorum TaxID=29533 RepID=A0ABY1J226_9FLAO|nr:hypothetical protein [Flavobacterium pectinovorum]SHM06514.1 hypothetical protein SAMN05444387_1830 [Flavobacterium pectinovorum]